jgi:chromosome segregation ATPase
MRKLLCSLAMALLLVAALAVQAEPPLAATEPTTAQVIVPPALTAPNPAVVSPAHGERLPPAGNLKQPAFEQGSTMPTTGAKGAATAGAAAGTKTAGATEAARLLGDPSVTEMKKLKYQIKTVRLSLAETQGRLAVTEKDLSTAASETAQLRSDNTNLRVGLVKAETVAKKSEEELAYRRQEAKAPQAVRTSSGSGALAVGLLLSLVIAGLLAVVLFGQGEKLRTILSRMHDGKADDKLHDQLRTQLREQQQQSQRFEEELNRLRAEAERQSNAPAGSKRERLDNMKRELREARAAVEVEKRQADERIQKLEAELARITADKQQVDERIQQLEVDKQQVDERIQKLEPELAQLVAEKQDVFEHVQKLEPEVARLTAEKADADERVEQIEAQVARLRSDKLRLERSLARAHEKLTFFGHDEPEETPPPSV